MYDKKNRSRSVLSQAERIGIFWLIGFILAFIALKTIRFSRDVPIASVSPERMQALVCELQDLAYQDSLRRVPSIYPFNPNFISASKAYQFGMSIAAQERLAQFRAAGKWIRSAQQFKEVTAVPDSVLIKMQPYFKFPAWTQNDNTRAPRLVLSKARKRDVNTATKEELIAVYGIGDRSAERIMEARAQRGRFLNNRGLYEVWGVRAEAIDTLLLYFTVINPEPIDMIDLHQASASDLATIPGVDFELAKKIWEFTRLRGGVNELEDFLKIEGMSPDKLRRIELYLKVEIR